MAINNLSLSWVVLWVVAVAFTHVYVLYLQMYFTNNGSSIRIHNFLGLIMALWNHEKKLGHCTTIRLLLPKSIGSKTIFLFIHLLSILHNQPLHFHNTWLAFDMHLGIKTSKFFRKNRIFSIHLS